MDVTEREQFEQNAASEAEEEAAFEAGFNATDIEEVPAAETNTTTPAESEEQAPPEAETPAEKELTVNDLKAMIEAERAESQKLRDKVFGKVGELQQRIDAAKVSASGISSKARERLKTEFPELAEMLFDNDSEPVQQEAPQSTNTQRQANDEDSDKKLERRLLARDHRDWEQVVISPEFSDWKTSSLNPQDSATLDESWDADFISAKITEFKKWQQDKAKKVNETEKQKQDRLNSGVMPRGVPRTGTATHTEDDEEAAMLQSFGRK